LRRSNAIIGDDVGQAIEQQSIFTVDPVLSNRGIYSTRLRRVAREQASNHDEISASIWRSMRGHWPPYNVHEFPISSDWLRHSPRKSNLRMAL